MKQTNSGWLIAGIFAACVLAAGASWWFRFEATHQAARYWGSAASVSIRDAPRVELLTLQHAPRDESGDSEGGNTETIDGSPANDVLIIGQERWRITSSRDVAGVPGMTHLRNALLEDGSFAWPPRAVPADTPWTHGLRFRDGPASPLYVLFSADYHWTIAVGPGLSDPAAASCEPIADGLREVFSEWSSRQTDER